MSALLAALASSAVAETIYKLAMGFLQAYLGRKDLAEKIRLEIAHEVDQLALVAATWKTDATLRPDGGGDLRVSGDAQPVPLPGTDPRSPRDPA